jgi:hypothetical protein
VERPLHAVSLIVLIVVFRSWTQLGLATYIPFLYRAELSSNPEFVAMLLFLFLGAGTVGTLVGGPLADRIGHRKMLFFSLALQVPLIHLFLISKGSLVFVLAAAVGATIVSTFSVTIVMAQELFPRRMATASGTIAGFADGGDRRDPPRSGGRPVWRACRRPPHQRAPRDRRAAGARPPHPLEAGAGGARIRPLRIWTEDPSSEGPPTKTGGKAARMAATGPEAAPGARTTCPSARGPA